MIDLCDSIYERNGYLSAIWFTCWQILYGDYRKWTNRHRYVTDGQMYARAHCNSTATEYLRDVKKLSVLYPIHPSLRAVYLFDDIELTLL